MNPLESGIRLLAPGWALRRERARALLTLFDGANQSRQRKQRGDNSSGKAVTERAVEPLRAEARHLERNHDLVRGALSSLTSFVIGADGIMVDPEPRTRGGEIHEDLAKEISDVLEEWGRRPEVSWTMDWPAAQRLLFRSWVRDGEVFAQRLRGKIPLLSHGSGQIPYSLELIECDQCPVDYTDLTRGIEQGIELNAWRRRRRYWMYKHHPGDEGRFKYTRDLRSIRADNMLHLALRDRIGQLRGVSQLASVITRLNDLKDYEESERIAAKIAASMAAMIKKGEPESYNPNAGEKDENGRTLPRELRFRPGMIFDDLMPGESLEMIDSNRPNPNLDTYRKGQLRAASAGFGISSSAMMRDYTGTYSSQRQELVENFGAYAIVAAEFINHCVRSVHRDVIEAAQSSGRLAIPADADPATLHSAYYYQPAMPWIDPEREAKAWEKLERAGYASGPEIIRRRGRNPRDVMEAESNWRRQAAERELVLTTDPANDKKKDPSASTSGASNAAPKLAAAAYPHSTQEKNMPKQWWEIRAAGDDTTEVLIYGDIGKSWWDDQSVEAGDFVEQLNAVDSPNICVRINSYGGSVSDGLAIHNALRRHEAKVTTCVDGVAVSIASLIAMAGDDVHMADNALFMVHAPWGFSMGNAAEMRKYAEVLDRFSDAMASSYERKTGKDKDTILGLLTDGEDHWYTAEEARDFGFVDVITDESSLDIAASLQRYAPPAKLVAAISKPLKEAKTMPEPKKPEASPTPAPELNEKQIRDQALAADRERRSSIQSRFEPFLAREDIGSDLRSIMDACCDEGLTPDAASERLLAKLGEGSAPIAATPQIESGDDARQRFIAGATSALLVRSGHQPDADYGNQFRGHSLLELARASLRVHNVPDIDAMSRMEAVAAAFTHSTGDFGNLLSNNANKSMLRGWEEAEETFDAWTNRGELGDFKIHDRVDLNLFPSLATVPEGGEFKNITVGDRKETIQLATYGNMFSITRQAIINDDLRAFTVIPERMGRAARRTIGDLVYAILTGNPTMSDGDALFHANHLNLLTSAVLSTAAIDAMRVAMATQKDPGSAATNLNIRLAHIIVPMALEGAAKVVRESEFEVGATSSTKANTVPNSVRGTFEVISEARLDAASASNWFGAANPSMHDTVEVAYLDGQDQPFLDQMDGWKVDGTEFKVRIDAAVKALDFRTLAKNPN